MTQDLDALIARLEKLPGPCRETDREILRLTNFTEYERLWWLARPDDNISMYMGKDEQKQYATDNLEAPRFTESVDAALTLVPEGWIVAQLRQWVGRPAKCDWYWQADLSGHGNYVYCGAPSGKDAPKTAAIALCRAALRARQTEGS